METDILHLAGMISGVEEREQEMLAALCTAAEQCWKRRLRKDAAETEYAAAFVCAAAFTAAADLLTARESSGRVSSFRAGEISVKETDPAEWKQRAGALQDAAEKLMAPYVEADDLSFLGVRG